MSPRYPVTLFAAAILGLLAAAGASAQWPNWYNYTDGRVVKVVLNDGSSMWAGCEGGGLVKIEKSTGARTYFNTANSGLRGMSILDIKKDAGGLLWIGTDGGGLVSFDGNATWTWYKTSNSGIPSNTVDDIAVDNAGNIWMATREGPVRFTRSNNEWRVFTQDELGCRYDARTRSIAVDKNNVVWVGHMHDGLFKYSGGTWTKFSVRTNASNMKDDSVSTINADVHGDLWIGNRRGWAVKFNEDNSKTVAIDFSLPQQPGFKTPDQTIYEIQPATAGRILVSTYTSLAIFDTTTKLAVRYPTSPNSNAGNAVFSAFADIDGTIYCGKMDGVATNKTGSFVKTNLSQTGMVGNTIVGILVDRDNKVHFGALGNVMSLDGTDWDVEPTEYREVRMIAIDSAGNRWITTASGVDRNRATQSIPGGARKFTPIIVDKNGIVWVGSESGLFRYDSSWTQYSSSNSQLPEGGVNALALAPDGTTIWIGMQFNGLVKYDGNTWTKYSANDYPEMGSDIVRALACDPNNGDVYVGTADAGFSRFNGTSFTLYNTSNSPLPLDNVTALYVDRNGTAWVGTGNQGIARVKGSTWNVFSNDNSGLPDNRITAIYGSKDLQVWIGTTSGGAVRYDDRAASGVERENTAGAMAARLEQNVPNPFSGPTALHISAPVRCSARLSVVDARGTEVAVVHEGTLEAGNHVIAFDPHGLASGMYYARLVSGGHATSIPLVLAR